MAEPVRARRLTDQEGRRLLQIVRRGKHESIRVRRAMIIMASASGPLVPAIARLVAADEDTVRDVIHAFDQKGLAALDPQWAGGRPRLISDDDVEVIVAAARTHAGRSWACRSRTRARASWRLLAGRDQPARIGRDRLRQILHAHRISFQRTRTVEGVRRPDRDAKLDRVEYVTSHYPDRCFAFDQFGPLSVRPVHRSAWAERKWPARLPATYTGPMASAISTAASWAMISCGPGTYRRAQRDQGADRRRGHWLMPGRRAQLSGLHRRIVTRRPRRRPGLVR